MADTTTTAKNAPGQDGYNFSATAITAQDYQTIKSERDEMVKKQEQANNEFMYQHYSRLLKQLDLSYDKATRANIKLENRTRREAAKVKREARKAKR